MYTMADLTTGGVAAVPDRLVDPSRLLYNEEADILYYRDRNKFYVVHKRYDDSLLEGNAARGLGDPPGRGINDPFTRALQETTDYVNRITAQLMQGIAPTSQTTTRTQAPMLPSMPSVPSIQYTDLVGAGGSVYWQADYTVAGGFMATDVSALKSKLAQAGYLNVDAGSYGFFKMTLTVSATVPSNKSAESIRQEFISLARSCGFAPIGGGDFRVTSQPANAPGNANPVRAVGGDENKKDDGTDEAGKKIGGFFKDVGTVGTLALAVMVYALAKN